jgi:chemotaxis protein MotB
MKGVFMKKGGIKVIVILAILTVGIIVSGCVSASDYKRMEGKYRGELQAMNSQKNALSTEKSRLETETQKLALQLGQAQTDNAQLNEKLKAEQEARTKLTEGILEKLQRISGIDVTKEGNAEIKDEVLFSPGRAELKEDGKKVLAQVAEVFQKYPEYLIRIEGHTDNDPITQSKSQWTTGSNFELAAYRALKVILYLEEKGIEPARMYLCSFGEYAPKKPNDSAENKSQNRRVVIGFVPIVPKESPKKPADSPEKDEMHK